MNVERIQALTRLLSGGMVDRKKELPVSLSFPEVGLTMATCRDPSMEATDPALPRPWGITATIEEGST